MVNISCDINNIGLNWSGLRFPDGFSLFACFFVIIQEIFLSHRALSYITFKDHSNYKVPSVYYFIIKYLKSFLFLSICQSLLICYERTPNKCWTKCGTIAVMTVKKKEWRVLTADGQQMHKSRCSKSSSCTCTQNI